MTGIPVNSEELQRIMEVAERMASRMNARFIPDDHSVEAFTRVQGNFAPREAASSHVVMYRERRVA